MKTSECPRCSKSETWKYIIQCRATIEFRPKFAIDMHNKLKRIQPKSNLNRELKIVINDIRKYLRQNEDNFDINQRLIRMKYLFQGFAIKV